MTGDCRAVLAGAPLFAALDAGALDALAAGFARHDFAVGDMLVVQNRSADGLFLIVSGTAEIGRRLPGGGLARLAVAQAGDVVGELALVARDQRHTASVIAQTPVAAWFLPAGQFHVALAALRPSSLQLLAALAAQTAARIAAKTGDIAAMLTATPGQFTPRPRRDLPSVAEDDFDAEAFLIRLPVCAAMSAERRAALWRSGERIDVAADTDLAAIGDAPDRLWLVLRGAVRSALPHGQGVYQLTVTGPGGFVGLSPLLLGRPHDRLLRSCEASILLSFDADAFRALLGAGDALSRDIGAAINADLVSALEALDLVLARIAAMQRGRAVAA